MPRAIAMAETRAVMYARRITTLRQSAHQRLWSSFVAGNRRPQLRQAIDGSTFDILKVGE
jgi:hypothetical protein